ncbi:MAG: hypothetical protein AVDCRST_MAG93-2328 [uncultured Chloroflexia bacterium]|uniref:Uncharacterized protein n=1 Tax=uncultured Chloroflexia bacterium TaxID=1672391 RepID=A0A6J4IX36_9CHLR|nr:MAG: hypothetical protein AVDCRST_MAG93-2328 [uncultured Chloroflexia bacterium]
MPQMRRVYKGLLEACRLHRLFYTPHGVTTSSPEQSTAP